MEYNQIIQGDCLEVMKGIPDKSIDLVITDPPYNLRNVGNSKQNGDLKSSDFGEWDEKFKVSEYLKLCKLKLKDKGQILLFCSDRLLLDYYPILRNEWNYKATIIWHKTNPAPSFRKVNYISSIEFILWAINERLDNCDYIFNFKKQKEMHNFIEMPVCGGNQRTKHPTQKPLKLVEQLLEIHSNKDDLILDPFLGSGTTAVACKELGRRYIGIEISPEYCEIARNRIKAVMELLF